MLKALVATHDLDMQPLDLIEGKGNGLTLLLHDRTDDSTDLRHCHCSFDCLLLNAPVVAFADIEFTFFSISSAYTCSEQMDDRVWMLLSNTPVYFAYGEGDYPS